MSAEGGVMADELSTEHQIDQAVMKHLREVYEDPAILTGWVIVAEFVDSNGTPDLAAFASTGMPYWKINGMIEAAPHEMEYAYEDEDEDEDL
jgi:hypothetical protein